MNIKEALQYMNSIKAYGIVPGLESVTELCRRMGSPQDSLKFVHIAGTNGKGSTLACVSTILQSAGYRVGRYLSPTIFEYRERIQVNGRPISKAALCEGVELVREICDGMVADGFHHPTPFEAETALAFWYFVKKKCDIVVLEAGMGGLLDATNLIQNTLAAVLTSVSRDHMKFLGNTLKEIAVQKAGIIKRGCDVVSIHQAPEVMAVIEQTAAEKGCPLFVADGARASHIRYGVERQRFDYDGMKNLEIMLAGRFQIDNAVLAVETVKALGRKGFPVAEEGIRKGLAGTRWPGRFTVIGKKPLFIADGAHNEDAAKKLADSIEFYFTNKRIIYIIGILKDKEYEKIIHLTHGFADQIITVTPPDNPRAMHAYELAQEIVKVHPGVTVADSLEEAVEMSYLLAEKDDVIIAFGSLSYLGRLMELVAKRSQERHGYSDDRSGKSESGGQTAAGGNR